MRCLTGNQVAQYSIMTEGIELSGADNQAGGGVLDSLQSVMSTECHCSSPAGC